MLIGAMLAVPVILLLVLRINAATVFLSLCLGSVLVQFVGPDAHSFASFFLPNKAINDSFISLGLLLVPVVFTMLIMVHTVRGGMRTVINLIPSLTVSVLGLFLAEPLFSPGLRGAIETVTIWHGLQRGQTIVVSISAIISLFFLWLQRSKRSRSHERKHSS